MPTEQSGRLLRVAQRIADALPPEVAAEVVVTGSVSRGVADDVSDIEMLIVTPDQLELAACFDLSRGAGLEQLGSWGDQTGPTRRVSGYRDGVPIELIWWSHELAEASVDSFFTSVDVGSSADALAHGVPLRTSGALARWQARLARYPEELVGPRVEDAALPWGGFAAAGLLTIVRDGSLLARTEWMLDGTARLLRIVYAVNRVWPATTKRVDVRVAPLAVKPERLAERIDEAFTEPDGRRALLVLTRLQLETVLLAPDGPNVNRARDWLANGVELLATGA